MFRASLGAASGLVGLVLCACAGTPPTRGPVQRPAEVIRTGTDVVIRPSNDGSIAETTVTVTPAAAWSVLPGVYEELGLGGGVLDAAAHTYGNPRVTATTVAGSRVDTFFRCPNEGTGASSIGRLRIRFSISTTVSPAENGNAKLRTEIVALGTPWEGTSTGRLACISKGGLETALEQQVILRAAALPDRRDSE